LNARFARFINGRKSRHHHIRVNARPPERTEPSINELANELVDLGRVRWKLQVRFMMLALVYLSQTDPNPRTISERKILARDLEDSLK